MKNTKFINVFGEKGMPTFSFSFNFLEFLKKENYKTELLFNDNIIPLLTCNDNEIIKNRFKELSDKKLDFVISPFQITDEDTFNLEKIEQFKNILKTPNMFNYFNAISKENIYFKQMQEANIPILLIDNYSDFNNIIEYEIKKFKVLEKKEILTESLISNNKIIKRIIKC